MRRVLFRSTTDEWGTPERFYKSLDDEFHFVHDPCPLGAAVVSGLLIEWKSPCFINPPYSDIGPWMEKALLESRAGKTCVLLVPSRTDTAWFHNYAMQASEIRFVRGRLRFAGAISDAPFPSAIIIFRPE